MDCIKIGRYIEALRKEVGLTQKALGEKIGVTSKTVSYWENGNNMPNIAYLTKLSKVLNISVNELISGRRLQINEFQKEADKNLIISLKQIESLKSHKKQYDFLVGGGVGILFSALYSPETIRKICIIIVSLVLICSGWILNYISEKNIWSK